jgi:hypothetical protein
MNRNIPRELRKNNFLEKAALAHGDKFDYSKVEYVNEYAKIKFDCPLHGEILMSPRGHLKKHGCNKCADVNTARIAFEKASKKFKNCCVEKHGNKYDYSKTEYTTAKELVTITCPIHGDFRQTPNCHLNGGGCQDCGKIQANIGRRVSLKQILLRCKEMHGDKFDYSEVEYDTTVERCSTKDKVTIICPLHGKFRQSFEGHLARPENSGGRSKNNYGCSKCGNEHANDGVRSNTEEFVKQAVKKHGDKFDYSEVKYKNCDSKVKIRCNKHDHAFYQTPYAHTAYGGEKFCEFCDAERMAKNFEQNKKKAQQMGTTNVFLECEVCGEDFEVPWKVAPLGIWPNKTITYCSDGCKRGKAAAASGHRRALLFNAYIRGGENPSDDNLINQIYEMKAQMNQKQNKFWPNADAYVVDHKIALENGGAHHQDNLRIITLSENSRKGAEYDPEIGGVFADNVRAKEFKKKNNIEIVYAN